MTTSELKCIHRHTIRTHPACFANGRVLQAKDKNMQKMIRQELTPTKYKRINIAKEPWYTHPSYSVGYFDIETSDFKANTGYLISYALKEKGKEKVLYNEITQKEIISKEFDKRLVRECLRDLEKVNILVTYYGTGFDLPFLRTRAQYWYQRLRDTAYEKYSKKTVKHLKKVLESYLPEDRRVPSRLSKDEIIDLILDRDKELSAYLFPVFGTMYHFDLYYTVRNKFKLHRNSLGVVTEFFGIEGKTHLKADEWTLVKIADPDIMPVIKEHNVEDVIILEKLHEIVNPYRKWTRKSI